MAETLTETEFNQRYGNTEDHKSETLSAEEFAKRYPQAVTAQPVAPKERTLGEAAISGAGAIPESLGKAGMGIIQGVEQAVLSPVETAKGVGKLVTGGIEKATSLLPQKIQDMIKLPDTEFEKEAKSQFGTMAHGLIDKYGSWKKFKEVLATDPAQFLMDAITFTPAGTAGRVGQVASKIPGVATATGLVSKIPGAGAISKAGTTVSNLMKAGISEIPGVETILQERGAEEMQALSESFQSSENITQLFAKAKATGGMIDTTKLKADAQAMYDANKDIQLYPKKVLKDLKSLADMPSQVDPAGYHKRMQLARELKERAKKELAGETEYGDLYESFHENLAAAGKGTKAADLKFAIAESRKDFNAEKIHEIMTDAISYPKGKGMDVSINPGAVLKKLEDASIKKELIGRVGQNSYNEIKSTMQRLNHFPTGVINPATMMAIGGSIGYMIGRGKGGAIGASIGMFAPSIISKAILTPAGRKMINKMLNTNKSGTLTRTDMNRLAAFVASSESAQDMQPSNPDNFWK